MNLKTRAMLHTAKIISLSIALVLPLIYFVSLITPQQRVWILLAGFVGFFIYIVYCITLGRLEQQEQLKQMNTPVDE
jgi:ABC-type anion transport system duplicated permease subunit